MPGLGLLAPWFLIGALAATVPLVLHLFRRQTAPVQDFSVVRFVSHTPVEQTRQRRLSDVLLLVLRMAALAGLALAFARPFLQSAGAAALLPLTVVLLDTSASVSAPPAWREARRLARRAVTDARRGPVAVIAFDDAGRVVIEPTLDRGAAHAAIDSLAPGYGGTSYHAAIRAAATLLDGRPGEITLVTDLQKADLEGERRLALPDNVVLRIAPVPPARENLAIVALQRAPEGLLALVANHGETPRRVRMEARLDARPLGEPATAEVGPGETAELQIAARMPAAGIVEARVEDAGGVPGDDTRWLVLDALPVLPVLVVTGSQAGEASLYVTGALESAIRADGTTAVSVAVRPAAGSGDDALLARQRVVVVLSTRGLDRRDVDRIDGAVRRGTGLLLAAGPDVEARRITELWGPDVRLEVSTTDPSAWPSALVASDPRHPVFSALGPLGDRLAQVTVDRGVRLSHDPATRVLARFANGLPALVESRRGAGRVLVFASDLGRRWNRFPLHPVFAPFVLEAVRHLAGPDDVRRELAVAAVPPGMPRRPGVIVVGSPSRRVAVNVDPRETRLETASEDELMAAVLRERPRSSPAVRRAATEAGQALWRWVLAAVFAVLVVESLAATRGRPARQGSSGTGGVTEVASG